ncbi:MAG: YesL family protein [Clostridia bacterium]|nr:YesL family protein [Clostridia bacterium]
MRKLFSMDNPLMKGLSVVADLLILNILTLLLSLPLITIGPAVTAMNDILIRMVRGEEGYTVKPYFHAFAVNFKKGMLLSVILLLSAGVLYVDYLAAVAYIPIMKAGILAIAVILLAIAFYAFGLLARYENTLRGTLKNAAVLAIGNFPRTLLMVLCAVGMWVICIQFYQFGVPVLMMLGLSLPCYVNVMLLNGVFHKLDGDEPKKKGKSE